MSGRSQPNQKESMAQLCEVECSDMGVKTCLVDEILMLSFISGGSSFLELLRGKDREISIVSQFLADVLDVRVKITIQVSCALDIVCVPNSG